MAATSIVQHYLTSGYLGRGRIFVLLRGRGYADVDLTDIVFCWTTEFVLAMLKTQRRVREIVRTN